MTGRSGGRRGLLDDLEVLVVLAVVPVASPVEACLGEEAVAEVVVVDLVGEVPGAVAVGGSRGGLYEEGAVFEVLVVGVVEGVDVDGESAGVLGEPRGGGDGAVAEA